MTLDEATKLTFEPVRNLFTKAIDEIGTEECGSYCDYLNGLGDIDEKLNAEIAFHAFNNPPNYRQYNKALERIKKCNKGNVNELMAYRENVPTLIRHIGELELMIYAWKYVAERFLNSSDNTNKRWEKEEDDELVEMACNNVPEVFMAARLKRHPTAIKVRLSYLVGIKRLSQKVAGKFIGTIDGEEKEAVVEGTVHKTK